MSRRLLPAITAALVLQLALAASAATSPASGAGPARSADQDLVRMGRQIPGFGGLYYDEQGRPNVYLLDPDGAGRSALKSLGAQVLVHRGDYEFERLVDWRLDLRPVLALPGVVFLDVDEARNRVVIGLDAASRSKSLDRDRLELQLLATSVPRQAVLLEETGRIEPMTGLRDKLRPAPGGAQIVFLPFVCTLGFNAFRGRDFGFVINSHCTNARGEVDGTRYSQNAPGRGTGIGAEIADPSYFTDPPCPAGRRCRMSDSAFAKYDKPNLGKLGQIARTASNGSDVGTVTLKNPAARLTITGRAGSAFQGEVVHKVGRTTGWTYGPVSATCRDINVSGADVTLLCQSLVRSGVGGGDSGSPVFYSLAGFKARLVGILWGGGTDSQGLMTFAFSPLENIEEELGPLKVN